MKLRALLAAVLIAAIALPAGAQWQPTKPPTGSPLVSADIRNNWAAIGNTIGGVNLLADPTFLIWPDGDTAAPVHWTLTGTGATVARIGTGLADTNRKVGPYAAKVVAGGGALAQLYQSLLTASSFDTSFTGTTFGFGGWIYATANNACRIGMTDGSWTTYSQYHSGSSAWVWLTGTWTVSGFPSYIRFFAESSAGQTCRFSGLTVLYGQVYPANFQPPQVTYRQVDLRIHGTVTSGADKIRYRMARPCLVKGVQLEVLTAPGTAALIADVNTWNSGTGTFQSMFAGSGTQPQIAQNNRRGNEVVPDGTYARRSIRWHADSSILSGSEISVDIDQTGGTPTELTIQIRCLQFERPLELFLGRLE